MARSFSKQQFFAIIPAAGIGSRMGSKRPKQYLMLNGKPLITHAIEALIHCDIIQKIVVAINPNDCYWEQIIYADHPKILKVTGGAERADSVLNGLMALQDKAAEQDWVVVHDAARPCLATKEIERLIQELDGHPVGGLLGYKVCDTIKKVDKQLRVIETLERQYIWHALTPQMFRFGLLKRGLLYALSAGALVTDESSAIELLGHSPAIIEGSATNMKVTCPEDLALAKAILESR